MRRWLACAFLLAAFSAAAQEEGINNDDFCVQVNETLVGNVLDNDFSQLFFDGMPLVTFFEVPSCFDTTESGDIFLVGPSDPTNPDETCCGSHTLFYNVTVMTADGVQVFVGEAQVNIEIKCDVKPDCGFVALEDWLPSDPAGDGSNSVGCIPVCERSATVLSWPYNAAYSYQWNLFETYTPGSHPAEIIVDWGAAGSSWVELVVEDDQGNTTSHFFCIDVLAAPPASFLTTGTACLNGTMVFDNPDPYVADYIWDFGDGMIASDDNPTVSHVYSAPGTYTVTLTATWPVYDSTGTALCCCSSVFSSEVEVSNLPGPTIHCVSTLCEGDLADYSTNATGCSTYDWTVLDADGNNVPYTYTSPDQSTIQVQWGSGPYGTVTLDVDGCDQAFCDQPSTVTIPIISSNTEVFGPQVVCANETATYAVPKWLNVDYNWVVTGGTIIANNGHTIVVDWGAGPVGTVDVVYESAFLAGLEGHGPGDCSGAGNLDVDILPAFSLQAFPAQVCFGSTGFIAATASPSNSYNWTIDPPAPFVVMAGGISVDWSVSAGTYVVTAEHVDGDYCNTLETVVVQVVEMAPPAGLSGPTEICPGETATYVATATVPGNTLTWNVTGGSPSFGTGTSLNITWNATGPYLIEVTESMNTSPFCASDPITLGATPKELSTPITIAGTANCTNSIESYSFLPAQHPDAVITWSVDLPNRGSIVAGQGTNAVDIQWNATQGNADLMVSVELCGTTISETAPLNLVNPVQPVISQNGILCPGVAADLEVTGTFSAYDWSTGSTTNSTSITASGLYSVTTTDLNGCEATAYYTAEDVEGPTAEISSPNNTTICIDNPHAVNLVAFTEPDYSFTWYCNGSIVLGPGPVSNFTHPFQGTPGSWPYWVVVENTATGCVETSNTIWVTESDCTGGGGCTPLAHTTQPFGNLNTPDCNEVQFGSTGTNWTPFEWQFGDGNIGGGTAPLHTYAEAGCYNVVVKGTVPSTTTGNCVVIDEVEVCVPLAANFEFEITDCREVTFSDLSTFLGAPFGTPINAFLWDFDGWGSSTLPNPVFTFPTSGSHDVTLTVFNSSGCEASITLTVNLQSVGVPSISASTLVACVGDPITFNGNATDAVTYLWDFGDTAVLGGATGQHTYTADGTYTVSLTATDAGGCTDQSTVSVLIHPEVPDAAIAGPTVICENEQATLVAPVGYAYLWTNGMTSPSITVGAGTYGVTLTDANGCTRILEPVTVTALPLPVAQISGNPFICDSGCSDLSTPWANGSTYNWYDDNGNLLQAGTSNQYSVCAGSISLPVKVQVQVISPEGCENFSDFFEVGLAFSPNVSISNTGTGCAGAVNELTVSPVLSGQTVIWNTGQSSATIQVTSAGTYIATVTDPDTGCSGTATYTVNPLPDLCSVPVGCYEDCDESIVCALPGLGLYQWNLNGIAIPGETSPCITIVNSGIYSLTITDPVTGCSATSGPLEMTIVPCGACDDVAFEVVPADADVYDGCCYTVSTDVNYPDITSMTLQTSDADFDLVLASVSPLLSLQTNTAGTLRFEDATLGMPFPQGPQPGLFTFCLQNATNDPQEISIAWTDINGAVLCEDSLELNCPVEPDCLFILEDSVYCEGNQTLYDLTLCNPSSNGFFIGWVELIPGAPGIDFLPNFIDLTASPIAPGSCQDVTLALTGSWADGDVFCFTMVAHAEDPAVNPSADCCPLDEAHCITLPVCDPCVAVGVIGVNEIADSDCCHKIELTNGFSDTFFDGIQVTAITSGVSFTVDNPVGSGWSTAGYTGTDVTFLPTAGFVPLGDHFIPTLCVESLVSPTQDLLIQWMSGGVAVCEEVVTVTCEPPCGYVSEEVVDCTADGTWEVNLWVTNTSDFTVSEVVISFPVGSPLAGYGGALPISPLVPGSTGGPITFNLGAPAQAGDEVCFTVTLHEVNADGVYLTCCSFEHCIELQPCDFSEPCACDDDFFVALDAGFQSSMPGALTQTFTMVMASTFDPDCDIAQWEFGDGTVAIVTNPTAPVTHTFPAAGQEYTVCVKIVRYAANGERCGKGLCQEVPVADDASGLVVYPNPNSGSFRVMLPAEAQGTVMLELRDATGRVVRSEQWNVEGERVSLAWDLPDAQPGAYVIGCSNQGVHSEQRILIVE